MTAAGAIGLWCSGAASNVEPASPQHRASVPSGRNAPGFFEKYWTTLLPATVVAGGAAVAVKKMYGKNNDEQAVNAGKPVKGTKRSSAKSQDTESSGKWTVVVTILVIALIMIGLFFLLQEKSSEL